MAAQVALGMACVLGVLAVTMDGGTLLAERRYAQATADAAALAAAADLYKNYNSNHGSDTGGTAKASALTTASANGYSNDGSSNIVTVNIPPTAGNFIGTAGYAEVIVQRNQQRYFSSIFGSGAIPLQARAVARGLTGSIGAGIILLDPSASGALATHGNGTLKVNGGSIVVDSSSSSAVTGTMTAKEFDIVGNHSGGTLTTTPVANNVNTGVSPTADPLSYLQPPNPSSLTTQSSSPLSITSARTLQPGVYVGGISISGNSGTVVTLQPGIYYMQGGGLSMTGQATLNGSGVTIYNAPNSATDVINVAGKDTVNLSPPTSGPYAGITIFQDRTSTAPLNLAGNGTLNISGTIYAANAAVNVGGNGVTDQDGSQIIARTLSSSGNGSVTINYASGTLAQARMFGLVE
jgi:hypothetical protein